MNLKTWCLQIWGVNTLSCLQYKNIIVDKNQSIPYFPPHCGIQCSIPSKVCPLRKRLPLSCHKNSSQIFDAKQIWKHTIPITYNTKTLISNISEIHRFSPQMRLIAYPDHKTTLIQVYMQYNSFIYSRFFDLHLKRKSSCQGQGYVKSVRYATACLQAITFRNNNTSSLFWYVRYVDHYSNDL